MIQVPHKWEVEEVDGGPLGFADFWICRQCTANGGPATFKPRAFLAGEGIQLSNDCDEAKAFIAARKAELEAMPDECPDCRRKVEKRMAYTFCSEYCYENPKEGRPKHRNIGDWAFLPCKRCGTSVEGEYAGEWFFWCKKCGAKEKYRVMLELLQEVLPILRSVHDDALADKIETVLKQK